MQRTRQETGQESTGVAGILEDLWRCQDEGYRAFHSRLLPTVPGESIIGVRVPAIRKLAKKWADTKEATAFLQALPHTYYEENNLHVCLIASIPEYRQCLAEVERFLPYIDNWATCDMLIPKVFGDYLPEVRERIPLWLSSGHTYTIRFGIGMLLKFYLGDAFSGEYLEWVVAADSTEYYVYMMIAWYFAEALVKQYDTAIVYLQHHRLKKHTHNKAIQKAIESRRISSEQKAYLRTLRR